MKKTLIKDRTLHRIRIIKGQVEGVEKMLEDEKYCIDVLHQSLAIQKALRSLDSAILEDHLHTCVLSHMEKGVGKKHIDELTKLYKEFTH